MTMRVMGIRGELTGRCLAVRDRGFSMDVDGEDFGADVTFWRVDPRIQPGALVFVVGRISFRDFEREARMVVVHADRVDLLDPPGVERRTPSGKVSLPTMAKSVEEVATAPPEAPDPATPRPLPH